MKINEFKKALYKALELKIYIDKNDFGDLQNKNMLNKDLGGALSDVINVLNDEINKMKKENKMNKRSVVWPAVSLIIIWASINTHMILEADKDSKKITVKNK